MHGLLGGRIGKKLKLFYFTSNAETSEEQIAYINSKNLALFIFTWF
jgi:hypothetical protein